MSLLKNWFIFVILVLLWLVSTDIANAQTSTATLSISPSSSSISSVGGTRTVNVNVSNAIKLGGFEYEVHYNPSIVKVNSNSDVTLGSFLGSTGRTATLLTPAIDNSTGLVKIGAFSFGSVDGPSGSGNLAMITFTAVSDGTSPIAIRNPLLSSSDATPVSQTTTAQNGSISVGSGTQEMNMGGSIKADGNSDGHVNIVDYVICFANYGLNDTGKGSQVGDYNDDGNVNGNDFMVLMNYFGM
jgi:hypothetical protein